MVVVDMGRLRRKVVAKVNESFHEDPAGAGIAGTAADPGHTYTRLITLLDDSGARYRLINHESEGGTAAASALRGHALSQAAKSIVVRIKLGRRSMRYALAVIPGDRRVNLEQVGRLLGGKQAAFASRETAELLAGCVSGSILPFSFHPDLHLIVDPELLAHEEIFFNAARLDRSVALTTRDYLALTNPRIEPIADRGAASDPLTDQVA